MAKPSLAVAVLAAGASRRFGKADKLTAAFRGKRLGEHVCAEIPREHFEKQWIITAARGHPCEPAWARMGFAVEVNPLAQEGMGTSVALAARLALDARCSGLLVVLADTPLVPASHYAALAARVVELGDHGMAVSCSGEARTPPAAFGAAHLDRLARRTGDRGARAILNEGEIVFCPSDWLRDIDTPEELSRLERF
ncbi:MAG: NTP transferase domain-containing protein [Pseudomonadota bacterium]